MTIREVISNVVTGLKEINADSILFNKYVYSVLFRKALFLIKRDSDQKRNLFSQAGIWSTLNIDMIEVDAIECDCIPFPTGLKIMRSKDPLPSIIETSYGFLFQSISTPDNSISLRLTTASQHVVRSKIKYNPIKYVFIENDYLWAPNATYPCIKISGMFNALTTGCSRMDNIFPCPQYLIDPCVSLAIQEISIGKQIPYDNIENKDPNNKTLGQGQG